jgi:hypothetical protein
MLESEPGRRKAIVFSSRARLNRFHRPGGDISWHNVDEEFQEVANAVQVLVRVMAFCG